MTAAFIHDDFLLGSKTARRLFHEHAAGLPIIDYHGHLDPRELAEDRAFASITRAWVAPDPYKHRAMRIAGVPERFITGPVAPREAFDRWAATVPLTVGNPLFHWTALELKRYFDIDELLCPATADRVWQVCNRRLRDPDCSARGLIGRPGVECVCTSDRLLDDLAAHEALARTEFGTRVLPSLRADDVVGVDLPGYRAWLDALGTATATVVNSYEAFQDAVSRRLDAFDRLGCRLSDHALDDFIYIPGAESETASLFARHLSGRTLAGAEVVRLRSGILRFLGLEAGRRGWIMQLHIGAQRHTSTRLRALAGPAGGYAAIGTPCDIPSLCRFLDDLETGGRLPRTILYPLNPSDHAALAVLTGSFVEDGVRGKVQLGPAWWYNDHRMGIRRQLDDLAAHGLLSTFVGMTTDSR
ncbi:MAG TPA: glucuronate isomerase, partial [Isosphaeraceae bacterium]